MRRFSSLVAILMLAACTTYYDPPKGWQGPYTASEVLNQALEKAKSKIDPMEQADDLTVFATIRLNYDIDPIDARYVVKWKRPGSFSIEVTGGPLKGKKLVSDGTRCVEYTDGKVSRADVPLDDTGIAHFMNRLFVLHYFRTGSGGATELKENTRGPKGETWIRLSKVNVKGRPCYLMLDGTSLEPRLMQTFIPFADGKDRAIDTYFDDYRDDPRAGRVPFVWKSYDGNKLMEELRIHSLAWNTGVDPRTFNLPPAAAPTGAGN